MNQRTLADAFDELEVLEANWAKFQSVIYDRNGDGTKSDQLFGESARKTKEALNEVKGAIRRLMSPIDSAHAEILVTHKGVIYRWSYMRNRPEAITGIEASTIPVSMI